MANLACIPVHILSCRVPDLDQADFFTIDFDIKQSELRHAITLARTLKGLLDGIYFGNGAGSEPFIEAAIALGSANQQHL